MKLCHLKVELKPLKLRPTQISFNTAISACGRCGQWQPALALLDIIPKRQIAVDVLALNGVLSVTWLKLKP